jgi:ArsR family transcriptional regulator, virulence genes transcriptional regulator
MNKNLKSGTYYKSTFNQLAIDRAAAKLRALDHPLRNTLLTLIDNKPGIIVTDLMIAIRTEQTVASQHLAILKRSGLIYSEREGKTMKYFIDYNKAGKAFRVIHELFFK